MQVPVVSGLMNRFVAIKDKKLFLNFFVLLIDKFIEIFKGTNLYKFQELSILL